MASCSKAVGRTTLFSDADLIRRIRLDIAWWLDLCEDYRTVDGALLGRRISQVGLPLTTVTDPTLEIYSDMSGRGRILERNLYVVPLLDTGNYHAG